MQTLSKGDFAAHIGVSAGRVSQYIAAGMIGPDALDGQGRNAKVIVARAVEQIRAKRDIGQALGNGISTRLELEPDDQPEPSRPPADAPLRTPNVDDELKQQRLEAERRRNRIAAQEEALRSGRLIDAGQVRAEMTKLAQAIDDENAGMLTDFATAVAAEYHMPQRDVLHLLRRIRNEKKASAAERARRRAGSLPEFVETIIEETAA
ncbi:hypothetical protein [Mesorhizobium opportunistum]|uniref:Uncharacterized protein n=1 Tax=Mesorhizobium opportunistum (strain LMG 24607 / HAMBI 3007 / WSM2075) TaxID=536019 RepID=F7XZW8_MESOW|nr:hypothetical protein [Mesorhizobium opportunistum]AEH88182.1 conserved hypothetical protein [Mesorhizobium opportunistum WSM2075]